MRAARGAATVELALGAMLWVTVTLLGLWMAEVSFLSTKVQEAAAAGVWNATGRQIDDFTVSSNGRGNSAYNAAIAGASSDTTQRYADFDGVGGSGAGTRRLMARGAGMSMSCVSGRGRTPLAFDSPGSTTYDDGSGATPGRVNRQLRRDFKARPATMCTASAYATPWQLPEHYLDQNGGFFNTPLRPNGAIELCGAGRGTNGRCADGYAVLLGDWAFDGAAGSPITQNLPLPLEVGVQPGTQRGNLPYRDAVKDLFDVSAQGYVQAEGASARFQRRMSNMRRLHNEFNFYMSYGGVENNYGDMLAPDQVIPDPACRKCHFNTTGTQPVNANPDLPNPARQDYRNLRQPCFLGIGSPSCTPP